MLALLQNNYGATECLRSALYVNLARKSDHADWYAGNVAPRCTAAVIRGLISAHARQAAKLLLDLCRQVDTKTKTTPFPCSLSLLGLQICRRSLISHGPPCWPDEDKEMSFTSPEYPSLVAKSGRPVCLISPNAYMAHPPTCTFSHLLSPAQQPLFSTIKTLIHFDFGRPFF